MIAEATKLCRHCNTTQPSASFERDPDATRGLQSWCKACKRGYRMERYRLARVNGTGKYGSRRPSRAQAREPNLVALSARMRHTGGIDPRPHIYAAKVASAVHGEHLTPAWVRLQCKMVRRGPMRLVETVRAA